MIIWSWAVEGCLTAEETDRMTLVTTTLGGGGGCRQGLVVGITSLRGQESLNTETWKLNRNLAMASEYIMDKLRISVCYSEL